MSTTLYSPQTRYEGKLTREFSDTGTGTIYFSSDKDLGITAGFFDLDAGNSKAETVLVTGITGTRSEYSGTVTLRGLREYGSNSNVSANQFSHRATSQIIISDAHQWIYQIIAAFNTHEDLVGAFHGFAGIGTLASRPVASGNANKLYFGTDTQALYISDGSSWAAAALGSSPNAGASTIGVTKLSLAPVDSANPLAVGDNDTRLTSAANMTDLTDGGDSTLHYHATDRARANHTGTQALSTLRDSGTAGETLAANDLVYFKSSDSKYWKAVDGTDSWNATHIVHTGGAADATVVLIPLVGRVALATNLTANTKYYRSATGTLTSTYPTLSSSTHIPMYIGRTDSAGNLVCNVQRLQRRKAVVQYQADVSSTTHTITVGFPISLVHCEMYLRNTSAAPYIYAAGTGYYDVIAADQQCSLRSQLTGYICAVETSAGVYYKMLASISSNNLVLTLDSATLPGTGSSFIVHVFEAL